MEETTQILNEKLSLLKDSRLQFLRLHKLLIDIEKANLEESGGQIMSGQFLNLLLNEPKFQWLRKFSMLIVEIDEMLDLDDGFSEEMVDKQLSQMREIINLKISDEDFKTNFENHLQTNPEVAAKHSEIVKMFSNQ